MKTKENILLDEERSRLSSEEAFKNKTRRAARERNRENKKRRLE